MFSLETSYLGVGEYSYQGRDVTGLGGQSYREAYSIMDQRDLLLVVQLSGQNPPLTLGEIVSEFGEPEVIRPLAKVID